MHKPASLGECLCMARTKRMFCMPVGLNPPIPGRPVGDLEPRKSRFYSGKVPDNAGMMLRRLRRRLQCAFERWARLQAERGHYDREAGFG